MTTIPFSTGWLFGELAGSEALRARRAGGPAIEPVTLPHCAPKLSWREWDPSSWERRFLYSKHFAAPAVPSGWRSFVHFDGALSACSATLNGHLFEHQRGGYRPFSFEMTGLLRPADNLLEIVVDGSFAPGVPPNRDPPETSAATDFWQPAGLYGEARLEVVPAVHIADMYARSLEVLDPVMRRLEVQCTIDAVDLPGSVGGGAASRAFELSLELCAGESVVSSVAVTLQAVAGRSIVVARLGGLERAELWDLEHPALYDLRARLCPADAHGAGEAHERRVRVGLRQMSVETGGFYLNGRRVQLFGLNRHHFYPFAGAAMPARVQRRDAEILRRELNCTMVRCSHYPQSDAFLDACDELGLLVFEEVPGWGHLGGEAFKDLVARDVQEMIRRHRNHPSIAVWGTRVNESEDDPVLYSRTHQLARSLDPDRATAGAKCGGHRFDASTEVLDAYNDYGSVVDEAGVRLPELEQPPGDRPYLVTEAVGTLSGPARWYRRNEPQALQQGQALAHARVHELAGADRRYLGVLAWSGFDYPSGHGNQYRGVKHTGVADLFREPKPGAAIYRCQVDPRVRPVIEPAFYWDFGPVSPVDVLEPAMICSNLERLEVFVGEEHHATLRPDRESFGHLGYPPSFTSFAAVDGSCLPELRIEGYLDAEPVLVRRFSSDPSGDRLEMRADDAELRADGVDATRVVLRAVDCFGAPRPYVPGNLALELGGEAVLVGDNPLALGEAGGTAAVWLRSVEGAPGKVKLSALHPLLGVADVTVLIVATEGAPGCAPPGC